MNGVVRVSLPFIITEEVQYVSRTEPMILVPRHIIRQHA